PRYPELVLPDLIPDSLLRSLSVGLTVITSMITPALLISASGTFVLSTSNRLGRVIDRVRALSDNMEKLMKEDTGLELLEERRSMIFQLIDKQTRRAVLLARALMIFYIATGMFVGTSVSIGVITIMSPKSTWIPVGLGIAGALMLLVGSIILVFEARRAIGTLSVETAFLGRLVQLHTRNRSAGM
ncbi:MAG TPA: DUF2721 domain-containing protein, partial [Bryobacteraceae bacterium]|nr:DUF2721 domain-containing protein [Bryobacteraceae bacterium]